MRQKLLVTFFIMVGTTPAFCGEVIDPVAELRAMRTAINAGDVRVAMDHAFAVQRFSMAQPWPDGPRPRILDPKSGDTSVSIGDQFTRALETGDKVKVKILGMALPIVVNRELMAARPSPAQTLSQLEQNVADQGPLGRFLQLPELAKSALNAGDSVAASRYANELLSLAGSHPGWPQGEAVFYGNTVAGQVALKSGNATAAGLFLLAAGKTTGSPRLITFGPGMALASDLLGKGEREVVLEYLSECKSFWRDDAGRLSSWETAVKDGKVPGFGPNLRF